ncbi:zinc transporter ZupT [Corynebacterium minutissimum]|uniref:zinc transporter ZupT n=1 Tax=unclassified Corynebacterium TaxID=2624378 RepID=UPI0008A42EE6|nr:MULTISPECIES: zinc transporter ZupT [unclassified Corynebacterium]MDK8763958.1 zinc transporter ZupT [Corynebacterium sp. MSK218]OFR67059.1 zinc transporter ZupT [Corynebacterium sp. HMSC078H07]
MELATVAFAFGLVLFSGLSTSIGGALAVGKREPGPGFMATALGLSAGVMLYVSFMEILPEGIAKLGEAYGTEKAATWAGIIAFFVGIAVIAIIDRAVPEEINPHEPATTEEEARRRRLMKTGVFTAFALALHNFPEGFATFLSGLEAPEIAIPIAVAIAIHNIPEGIAVAVPLRAATGSRKKAFWWATISGLAEPVGALIGFAILMPFIGPVTMGFSFAAIAGIMVFISLDELLPTAEETGKHHFAIYGLIAGMAIMAVSLLLFM